MRGYLTDNSNVKLSRHLYLLLVTSLINIIYKSDWNVFAFLLLHDSIDSLNLDLLLFSCISIRFFVIA